MINKIIELEHQIDNEQNLFRKVYMVVFLNKVKKENQELLIEFGLVDEEQDG